MMGCLICSQSQMSEPTALYSQVQENKVAQSMHTPHTHMYFMQAEGREALALNAWLLHSAKQIIINTAAQASQMAPKRQCH